MQIQFVKYYCFDIPSLLSSSQKVKRWEINKFFAMTNHKLEQAINDNWTENIEEENRE